MAEKPVEERCLQHGGQEAEREIEGGGGTQTLAGHCLVIHHLCPDPAHDGKSPMTPIV